MHNLTNHLKTAALMGGLIALFVLVGNSLGGKSGMIIALVVGGLTNIGAWFFSDKLAIAAMRAREVDRATSPELINLVDELRQRAGLPMPRVYLCPHEAPNAFATGRSPSKAAVAFTQGLIRSMSRDEIAGVIAHELAHIKHRDTLISCIAATIAGVLAFIAQWFFFIGGAVREGEKHPLVGFLTVIMAAVGAALIQSMISRSREYAADAEAARLVGSPDGLISALQRLDSMSRRIPLIQPNPAQNNLFIVEPLAGKSLANLFATHPPVEARIAALRRFG